MSSSSLSSLSPPASSPTVQPSRAALILITILLTMGVAVNLYGLSDYPAVHCDEGGDALIASQFLSADQPYLIGHFYYGPLGLMLAQLGASVTVARLHSTLGWLLGIAFVFLAGRKSGGWLVGGIAALVYATSLNVFWASHLARPEIWVVAGLSALLYLLFSADQSASPLAPAVLGALTVLNATGMYLNGGFFAVAIAGVVLVKGFRTEWPWKKVLLFAAGATTSLLAWLLLVALPLYESVVPMVQQSTALHCAEPWCLSEDQSWLEVISARLVGQVSFMKTAYLSQFNGLAGLFGLYFLVGVVVALYRRARQEAMLLGVWALSTAAFTLVEYKNPMYSVLWEPLAALIIAFAAVRGAVRVAAKFPRLLPAGSILPIVLVLPLVGANLAAQAWLSYKFSLRDFEGYLTELKELIPPGEPVFGVPELWFGFQDRNPFTADWLIHYTVRAQDPALPIDFDSILGPVDFDYAVYNGTVACSGITTPLAEAYGRHLEATCTPVGRVVDRWFGAGGQEGRGSDTVVYRCTERRSGE